MIVCVLVASLIECFLVLPGHLRIALRADPRRENRFARWFNPRFDAFRDGPFARIVRCCVAWRYLTVSVAIALLLLFVGLVAGGRISFVFFPSPESDSVLANVTFVEGTKRETTIAMVRELERALNEAEAALTGGAGGLVVMSLGQVGKPASRPNSYFLGTGDHVGGMRVELRPSDRRAIRTQTLIEEWRSRVRPLPGLETMTILERQAGPPGREIDIRVTGDDVQALKAAAGDVRALLGRFPGVSDIEDDTPYGKQEAILTVTPRGRALGFTTESAAGQVRARFEGVIAKRFARGDEEVAIRVRLPHDTLTEADLRLGYVRSSAGAEVPLAEVVSFDEKTGFASIRREDGQRMVAVTAEVDEQVTTTDEVPRRAPGRGPVRDRRTPRRRRPAARQGRRAGDDHGRHDDRRHRRARRDLSHPGLGLRQLRAAALRHGRDPLRRGRRHLRPLRSGIRPHRPEHGGAARALRHRRQRFDHPRACDSGAPRRRGAAAGRPGRRRAGIVFAPSS